MNKTCVRIIWHSNHVVRDDRSLFFPHVPVQRWNLFCLQMHVVGIHSSHEAVSSWRIIHSCPDSDRWACSEPNFLFPFVFQGDLWWKSRSHVYFFVSDFSSYHPNNFQITSNWKCFVKDDCIRSSLREFWSFLNSKIYVNPMYCVLMSLPMQVLCTTKHIQVNLFRIVMLFVSGIYRQEEYCLFLARILTSRSESTVDDRMQIERTFSMENMLEVRNNKIVL